MIQRIQSIFLLIAIVIPIVLIFIPLGYIETDSAQYVFNAISLKENVPDGSSVLRVYYVAFCLFLTAVLAGVALFSFKNRIRQMQIVSVTMIVYLVSLLLILWVCPDLIFTKFFAAKGEITSQGGLRFNIIPLIILIVVEAVSLFCANYFIKKDEKLVRSADRIR